MNRREMFAALAATAVAGDVLAFAQNSPGTTPAAAPAAPSTVMGSKVFDWNAMVDKPSKTGSVRTVCSTPTATLENLEIHISTLNPGHVAASSAQAPQRGADHLAAGHGGDAFERRVDPRGAGIDHLQRVEPGARFQECGDGAGDLSRGEREDGRDTGGIDGRGWGMRQGPSRSSAFPGPQMRGTGGTHCCW